MQAPVGSNDAGGAPAQPASTSSANRRVATRPDRGSTPGRVPVHGRACPRRGGARLHLVRASRGGARTRPTIDPVPRRQGCHCPAPGPGLMFWLRRPAIEPGVSWGVGHGTRKRPFVLRMVRSEGSRIRFTSRITGHRPTGLVDRRDGSAYRSVISNQRMERPPAIGGRSRVRRRTRAPGQAERPGRSTRSGTGRARRRIPRRSSSAWTTRAAATSSGSRVTVPLSQSM